MEAAIWEVLGVFFFDRMDQAVGYQLSAFSQWVGEGGEMMNDEGGKFSVVSFQSEERALLVRVHRSRRGGTISTKKAVSRQLSVVSQKRRGAGSGRGENRAWLKVGD